MPADDYYGDSCRIALAEIPSSTMTSSFKSNNVLLTESVRAGIKRSEYLEGVLNCEVGGLRAVDSYAVLNALFMMFAALDPFSFEQSNVLGDINPPAGLSKILFRPPEDLMGEVKFISFGIVFCFL